MIKYLLLALGLVASLTAQAERLKDIASIQGVRSNQLIGYGLVVGLNGTGDQTTQTPFTLQTFNNMLTQFGIKVPANIGSVQLKNVAAVSIHADLPPFAKPGQTIDITVSSIGNAKSLRGGSCCSRRSRGLTATSTPSPRATWWLAASMPAATTARGSPSTCRPAAASPRGLRWSVRCRPRSAKQQPDPEPQPSGLHHRQEHRRPRQRSARPGRGQRHRRRVGAHQRTAGSQPACRLHRHPGKPGDRSGPGRRQGHHQLAHRHHRHRPERARGAGGGDPRQSDGQHQRGPDHQSAGAVSEGETVVVPNSRIKAEQERNPMFKFAPGTTLDEIVRAVNQVGAAPSDLMAILEASSRPARCRPS